MSVVAGPLDEEVTEQVIAALSGPGLAAALRTATGDDEERLGLPRQLTTDEERLEQLAGDYADGLISRSEWRVAHDRLTARIASTRHRLSSNGRGRVLASLPNTEEQLRARWQDADMPWRRAVVDAVVESVVVAPKGHRGGKQFDPARVEVTLAGVATTPRSNRTQAPDGGSLDELARAFADGDISRREWLAGRDVAEQRIAAARNILDTDGHAPVLADSPLPPEPLQAEWAVRDVEWRRTILTAVIDRVVVNPAAVRGRRVFDPSRIAIIWRA